jgi:hypothetical protein
LWWFWDGIFRIDWMFINKKNHKCREIRLGSYFWFGFDSNC